MAVRVFAGNTVDPTTLPEQIKILKQRFRVEQVVLVDQTPYATTFARCFGSPEPIVFDPLPDR